MSWPLAHCEFHELEPAKHPNGTPEYADAAAKRFGYEPAITFVIIAPEDDPVTKTLLGSTPYVEIEYDTMDAIP